MKVAWYYKLLFVAIIAVAIFLWGRGCGIHSVITKTSIDTTVKKDSSTTRYVPIPYKVDSIIYRYKIVPAALAKEMNEKEEPNTSLTYVPQIIEREDTSKAYYKDTLPLKRGFVVIDDTLQKNRIIGRRVFSSNTDTTITKTVTIIPPKKNILYFGISGMGNKNDLLFGAGADLSLKTKSDKIYSIGTKYLKGGNWYFEGGIKFAIKLKK